MQKFLKKTEAFFYYRAVQSCVDYIPFSLLLDSNEVQKDSFDFKIYTRLIKKYMDLLGDIQHSDPSVINILQELRLTKLINVACGSVWWLTYFQIHGVGNEFKDILRNFKNIPPVDRTKLVSVPAERFLTVPYNSPLLLWRKTSGSSTGTPFVWALDKRAIILNVLGYFLKEFETRGFSFEKNSKRNFFFQFNIPWSYQLIQNFCSEEISVYRGDTNIKEKLESLTERLNDSPVTIAYTISSGAILLMEELKKLNLRPSIPFFLITGEPLDDRVRAAIVEYFGSHVVSLYGTQETGSIGVECIDNNSNYHVLDRMVVEILDQDGREMAKGKEGLITLTCLDSLVMPLLRYQPGDIGLIHGNKVCKCENNRLPLLEITGRATDIIYLANGESVSAIPLLRNLNIEPLFSFDHKFQIEQKVPGEIIVTVMLDRQLAGGEEKIQGRISKLVNEELFIIAKIVPEIAQSGAKFKKFIPMQR